MWKFSLFSYISANDESRINNESKINNETLPSINLMVRFIFFYYMVDKANFYYTSFIASSTE